MSNPIRLLLHPLGKTLDVEPGTPLQDVLFDYGVEFPCGGQGVCRGCRIRVLSGDAPITPEQESILSETELEQGWRLACCLCAESDLTLELAQWDVPILADNSCFEFTPAEGLGIAIDVGTTTVVAQLVDRSNGHVLGVRSGLNPQAQHGSDLMSRIHYAIAENGHDELVSLIRASIKQLIDDLLSGCNEENRELQFISLVGNTVMHHFFCGIDTEPLAGFPFESGEDGVKEFSPGDLGWEIAGNPALRFLPCPGSFVGSDLLAGILASRMHESGPLIALIDLGTNGEILVGNREKIVCSSTAAGPAFEGGKISMGMRASTGAIHEVIACEDTVQCRVIGGGKPAGICGSGLVDAVAAGLRLAWIDPYGRLTNGRKSLPLEPPVVVSQKDIRELQLAKGAIAAGLQVLLRQMGKTIADVECLYLAGAFGNNVNTNSAKRIGLFDSSLKVHYAGNTALLGAKMALFPEFMDTGVFQDILDRCQHVVLSGDPDFQEKFVDEMLFPEG